jgi:hypothetical protein
MPFSLCSTQPPSPHNTLSLLSLVPVDATGAYHTHQRQHMYSPISLCSRLNPRSMRSPRGSSLTIKTEQRCLPTCWAMEVTPSTDAVVVHNAWPNVCHLLLLREPAGSTAMSPSRSQLNKKLQPQYQNIQSLDSTCMNFHNSRMIPPRATNYRTREITILSYEQQTSLVFLQQETLAVLPSPTN